MSFADRLKRATAGVGDALGIRRRPGVELVRVDLTLAPPTPTRLLALPAPKPPLCRYCKSRHEPRPHHPAGAGRGLAAAYGRSLLPDPSRPGPLGRGPAHDKALYRDQVSPWRHGILDPPPPSVDLDQVREEYRAPRVPWWER